MKKCCAGCVAWERDGNDGICRRFTPRARVLPIAVQGFTIVWPRTSPDDWCHSGYIALMPEEDE